jgi:hypothetical protein
MESSQWENYLLCRKVSVLTGPHCQFRGVGQGRNAILGIFSGIIYLK